MRSDDFEPDFHFGAGIMSDSVQYEHGSFGDSFIEEPPHVEDDIVTPSLNKEGSFSAEPFTNVEEPLIAQNSSAVLLNAEGSFTEEPFEQEDHTDQSF